MTGLREPIELNSDGLPISPSNGGQAHFGKEFDAVVARDFLGLKVIRRRLGGTPPILVYQAAYEEYHPDGTRATGPYGDVPPWSVGADQALYLLDFTGDFEIGTSARGIRCVVWIRGHDPMHEGGPELETTGYGEADKEEFGTDEEWINYQGSPVGYGPPLALAICRAVYQASQNMDTGMQRAHFANIKRAIEMKAQTRRRRGQ